MYYRSFFLPVIAARLFSWEILMYHVCPKVKLFECFIDVKKKKSVFAFHIKAQIFLLKI